MIHSAIISEYKVSKAISLLPNPKIKNYLFARKRRLWKNQVILYENLLGIPLIDAEGYRANVGIVIINDRGQVFWARRFGQHSWQYPQGGVDEGETAEETMYRELHEEVGLKPEHVKIVASTKHWLRYKLPKRLIRHESKPVCIGQKQKWFLLKLTAQESAVDLLNSDHPEFDDWRWVSYWYPVRQVVSFKREVYRKVMKEFAQASMPSYRPNHRKRRG